ncbi:translocation/assembly module TamB domain-containing protein, partial [Pseudomonadota bacterium]
AGVDAKVDGRLRIELNDLDLLAIFIPVVNRAEGRFNADLVLSGSPVSPFFSGPLSLSNGLIANEATGLTLSDIQLSGEMIGSAKTQLTGSFRAREGTGNMQATLDFSDVLSPRVELSLHGKNLTLLDAPDLKVVAEPDVELAWQDGVIDISGRLMIPKAHIAPSVLPESTVSTSPDLVIVAGEIPGSKVEDKSMPNIAIRGEFEVVLGDEVELDLSVAEADVDGSVKFTWQDDLIPLANGSFRMVGEIQTYGQLLQITEAQILFPGIPADNPHLNIRAERQIYGNSEIRRAGVFVTGTLRRPIIEPYTDPMTNRERAQTLLITGSDFNMETGVGAVDIGTYIAPRVFVSYGIGVFEDENVISIRYDLGRNWGVKATSGQRQTGIDMSYTIER